MFPYPSEPGPAQDPGYWGAEYSLAIPGEVGLTGFSVVRAHLWAPCSLNGNARVWGAPSKSRRGFTPGMVGAGLLTFGLCSLLSHYCLSLLSPSSLHLEGKGLVFILMG